MLFQVLDTSLQLQCFEAWKLYGTDQDMRTAVQWQNLENFVHQADSVTVATIVQTHTRNFMTGAAGSKGL